MPGGTKPAPRAISREISDIIRAALARRRKTQKALAEALGIKQPQASRLLSAKKTWDVDQVEAACRLLDLDFLAVVSEAEAATAAEHASETDADFIARAAAERMERNRRAQGGKRGLDRDDDVG